MFGKEYLGGEGWIYDRILGLYGDIDIHGSDQYGDRYGDGA